MIEESIFKDTNSLIFNNEIIRYIIDKKVEHEPGIRKLEHTFKQIISKLQYSRIINCSKNEKCILDKKTIDGLLA